jgi:peptidoglycan hydrolase-like protein with peptidoglycan-binding domain
MSKAFGFVLILAGFGVASSLLPLGSEADPGASRQAAAPEPVRTVVAARSSPLPESTAPRPAAKRGQPAAADPPEPAAVIVTLTHRAEPAPSPVPAAAKPAPADKGTLARELQLELRRVGCYGGEINGIWTPNTRKAMKAFTERVNATLPVEKPDDILLSLVRAHQDEACAGSCPPGHGLSDDGRCAPSTQLAQAAKRPTPPTAAAPPRGTRGEAARKPTPAASGWTTVTASAPLRPAAPPPAGRMALAGPNADAPGAATEPPPGLGAAGERGKHARVARRASKQARARRPERVYVRTYASRSSFVESVLYDRRSLN